MAVAPVIPNNDKKRRRSTSNDKKKEKKKRRRCSASGGLGIHIPDDIIFGENGILARLPSKSLMRFKCVSKLWHSTIANDPLFHRSHHYHASSRSSSPGHGGFLVLFNNSNEGGNKFFYTPDPSSHSLSLQLSFSNRTDYKPTSYRVTQVINGLLCYYTSFANIHLCNVSTHETFPLPYIWSDQPQFYYSFAFGFDQIKNVYKLLNLVMVDKGDRTAWCYCRGILTITNQYAKNYWRPITINTPPDSGLIDIVRPEISVCINSALYWIGRRQLVIFDLNKEKFELRTYPMKASTLYHPIRLPDQKYHDHVNVEHGIVEIGGRPALVESLTGGNIFIWKFNDSSTPKKWDQVAIRIHLPIHLHEPARSLMVPLATPPRTTSKILFTNGSVFSTSRRGDNLWMPLYSYDLTTQKWEALGVDSSSSSTAYKHYTKFYYCNYHVENISPLKDLLAPMQEIC